MIRVTVAMGGDLVPQAATAPDAADRPQRDELTEAADWEWARQQARDAPRWSDEKWRRMNALLRVKVNTRER